MKNVLILDTTLREGEQTPGVSFSIGQKLEIARALDSLGVDMIEVGHPTVSKDIDEFIKEVVREDLKAELVVHSRACDKDIDAALSTGVNRIAIFLGSSKVHLHKKLEMDIRRATELVYRSVKRVAESGLKVRFTAEDATRADLDTLIEICHAAVDAGADRISLPDTVGIVLPDEIRFLFRRMKKELGVSLDAHCHNDLGLSIANSLAAYEGGADCIHVTVNGLGERAGITPLCNLAVALKILYGIDTVDLKGLEGLARMVEEFSGVKVPMNRPVIGENAFSHKAGVHTSGVLKDPTTYEPFSPELIGRDRRIIVDKFTGKGAVKARLQRLGIELEDKDVTRVVEEIKNSIHPSVYTDEELLNLINVVSTGGKNER
jgi:2-isopropylmalate synthase